MEKSRNYNILELEYILQILIYSSDVRGCIYTVTCVKYQCFHYRQLKKVYLAWKNIHTEISIRKLACCST